MWCFPFIRELQSFSGVGGWGGWVDEDVDNDGDQVKDDNLDCNYANNNTIAAVDDNDGNDEEDNDSDVEADHDGDNEDDADDAVEDDDDDDTDDDSDDGAGV